MFSKKDLQDNDIVYYRDESKRIVKGKNLLDIDGNICYNLNRYREDLIEKNDNISLAFSFDYKIDKNSIFEINMLNICEKIDKFIVGGFKK